jgi:hypothetical protein
VLSARLERNARNDDQNCDDRRDNISGVLHGKSL